MRCESNIVANGSKRFHNPADHWQRFKAAIDTEDRAASAGAARHAAAARRIARHGRGQDGAKKMTEENQVGEGCSVSARPTDVAAKAARGSKPARKKRVTVLDMGEASREEGFRLNGCR